MPTLMIRANQYSFDLCEALRGGRETEAEHLLGLLARVLVKAIAVDRPRVRDALRKGFGEAMPIAAMTDVEGHTTPRLRGMIEMLAEMADAPLPMKRALPPPPKDLSDLALRCLERLAIRGGNGGTGVLAHDLAVRRTRLTPALEEFVEVRLVDVDSQPIHPLAPRLHPPSAASPYPPAYYSSVDTKLICGA